MCVNVNVLVVVVIAVIYWLAHSTNGGDHFTTTLINITDGTLDENKTIQRSKQLEDMISEDMWLQTLRVLHSDVTIDAIVGSLAFLDRTEEVFCLHILHCNISTIPANSLSSLPNLEELNLSYNQLETIDDAFAGMTNLLNLFLAHNNIVLFPYTALSTIAISFLDLSNNYIVVLDERIAELTSLTHLCIQKNRLESLSPKMTTMTNLTFLNISNNNLTTLNSEFLSMFNRDSTDIILSGNPWSCDCNTYWLINWVQQTEKTIKDKQVLQDVHCHGDKDVNMTVFDLQCLDCSSAQSKVAVPGEYSVQYLTMFAVVLGVFIIIIIGIVLFFGRRPIKSNFHRLQSLVNSIYYFSSGSNTGQSSTDALPRQQEMDHTKIIDVRYAHPSMCGRLRLGRLIGRGAFGHVYEGFASGLADTWTKVAVKKLSGSTTDTEQLQLTEEYQQMLDIGCHPNVISLLGSSVVDGCVIILMEFAALGDLLTYLRMLRRQVEREKLDSIFGKSVIFKFFPEILLFAWHVSKGMEHLASLKIVHRDLAARNILLVDGPVAKVSDFGLSRDVYESGYYYQDKMNRLPYKWMSPESLLNGRNTIKSDVWSFGILLWELVTFGSGPYPGIPPETLLEQHRSGYVMPQPLTCPDNLYNIMRQCWYHQVDDRPDFSDLVNELDKLLQTATNKPYLEIHAEAGPNSNTSDSLESSSSDSLLTEQGTRGDTT